MIQPTGMELDIRVGYKLNILIAERVFGETLPSNPTWDSSGIVVASHLPKYATNMRDAWQVAEWITAQGYRLEISVDADGASCEVWAEYKEFPDWRIIVEGNVDTPTAPEAICRAALALVDMLEAKDGEGEL